MSNSSPANNRPVNAQSPSLEFTPLEPMILMSAVPVDMNQIEATDQADFIFGTTAADYVDGKAGDDFLAGGAGDDHLLGGSGNDYLAGDAGNDTLEGGEGDDLIEGGLGNNAIDGGEGNDTILAGIGNDSIDGGAGFDVIDYYLSPGGVDIDLTTGHATNGIAETDFANIEAVIGSQHDDVFRLSAPQEGSQFFILGGQGSNVIDLSQFHSNQISISNGVLQAQSGIGEFSIYFQNVSQVLLADRTENFNAEETRWPDEVQGILPSGFGNGLGLFSSEGEDDLVDEFLPGDGGNGEGEFFSGNNVPTSGNSGSGGGNNTNGSDPSGSSQSFQLNVNGVEDQTVTGNALDAVEVANPAALAVTRVLSQPFHGTLSVDASGAYSYEPTSDFFGVDSFIVEIFNEGSLDQITVTIDVAPVSDAPRAVDDSFNLLEDTIAIGNVLTNDSDVDGNAFSVTGVVTQASHGHVTIDSEGNFRYTPIPNFHGQDNFTYELRDATGETRVAQVTLNVFGVNDGPVAVNDQFVTNAGVPLSGNLLSNDTDIDGDTLRLESLLRQPVGGTVLFSANGNFSYTPIPGFSGTDSFEYVVKDDNGGTSIATVEIQVSPLDFAEGDDPFAAPPTVVTVQVDAGQQVPVGLVVPRGIEAGQIEYRLSGLPSGTVFNQGLDLGDGQWRLRGDELEGLLLITNENVSGEFDVVIHTSVRSVNAIVEDDFATGETGWAIGSGILGGTAQNDGILGPFGGTGGSQGVSRSFQIPDGIESVVVEFDFLEGDSWDGERFLVFGNDLLISSDRYFIGHRGNGETLYGIDGDHAFTRASDEVLGGANLPWSDQTHRYRLEVPVVNGEIKLGFGSTLNQGINDESWAIDNLVISSNFAENSTMDLRIADVMDAEINAVNVVGDPSEGELRLLLDTRESETQRITSVVVSGVPTGIELNAGQRNANGSVTLLASELENLKLSGTFSQDFVAQVRTNYTQIKTLYSEDFEQGAGGWSANTVQDGSDQLTSFLGRFNEQNDGASPEDAIVSKTFAIASNVDEVIIEFDQLQLGEWEDSDQFVVYINGEAISASELKSMVRIDEAGNAILEEVRDAAARDLGFESSADQVHRFAIRVATNGPLTIGFGANLGTRVGDEAWGIDNLRISYVEKTNQIDSILIPGIEAVEGPKNLIVNGSFEIFTNAKETSWGHVTQSLAGWALESGTRFEPHKPRSGINATDGNVWLDMGLSPGNLVISQTIEGVEDGKQYELSFDLADSVQDKTDGLEVFWNGEKIADFDSVGGTWVTHKLRVEGGSGDGTNELTFRGTGDSNNFGVSLDNVEMFEVESLFEVASDLSGTADANINLGLRFDTEALSDDASVVISNLPPGAVLTKGIDNGDGTWTVPADQLAITSLRTPTSFSGPVSLSIEVEVPAATSPNLIVNGSFEDNDVAGNGWGVSNSIKGWTSSQGEGFEVQVNVAGGAADGNAKVELDSHDFGGERLGTNSGMVQEVPTVAGETYQLSFEYSPRPGVAAASNGIEVLWNGQVVKTVTANGAGLSDTNWSTQKISVDGNGTTGRLEFRAVGTQDSLGGYIDNVRLVQNVRSTTTIDLDVAEAKDPANFIANGSFENLDGLKKAGFGHFGDELSGWELEAGPRFEVHNPRAGVDQAADGEYWLDLDASPGNVTISQQVLGLEDGKVYELTFETANSNPFMHAGKLLDTASNGLEVFWNGEKVSEVLKEDAEFTSHTLTLRAGSGNGSNTLTFRGTGAEDNVGISLDNIRMVESSNLLVNGSFENLVGTTDQGWGLNAKAIQGWTLEENGTLVAQENFESGAEGWSNNTVTETDNAILTDFLGKFGGSNGLEAVSKTFELNGDHNYAVMEFDFLKLDSWDANNAWGQNERLNIFLNGKEVLAFTPEGNIGAGLAQLGSDALTGTNGNVRYVITSSGSDVGLNGVNDHSTQWQERVYHVRLEVINPGEALKLGFGSTLNQGINDESFGIDNVTVFGADNPNTSLNADGTFSASGNAFEVHRPRGGVEASDGEFWLDMGGSASNVTIAQQIPGLDAGQSYVVAFDVADSIHDRTDGLDVIWNGEVVAQISGQDITMDRFEFEVKAGSGDGTDTLKFRGTGDVNNFGVSLDNVTFEHGSVEFVTKTFDGQEVEAGNAASIGVELADQVVVEKSTATVSGVPEGAKLNVGERNADGTWTVPANQLASMALRTPTSFAGPVSLSVDVNATLATSPNLVVNGSFEDNAVAGSGWGVTNAIKGWTSSQGEGFEVQVNVAGKAADGSAKVELDSHDFGGERLGTNSGMVQEIATAAGESYQLSFEYSPRPGVAAASNGIEVLWNGQVVKTVTANGAGLRDTNWSTQTISVEGNGTTGRLEFRAVGTQDSLGGYIDNVELVQNTRSTTTIELNVAESKDPGNLLVNGSFENIGDATIANNGWNGFQKLEGWTLEAGQQMEVVDSGHRGVESTDGNFWLDLGASPGNVSISQEVLGVEPGRVYELTFDTINTLIGGKVASDNGVAVYFGGEKLLEVAAGEELTESHFVELVGGAGDGSNKLVITGLDATPDNIGMALDNVRLQPSSNLIVNGSFENLKGTVKTGFGHVGQQIQGWTLDSGDRFEVHNPRGGVEASDGDYWLDMGGSPSNVSISQNVAGVEPGETYQLSFDLADSAHDLTDGIEVVWNGEVIARINNLDTDMTRFSMEVVGGSGDGSNVLRFRGTGEVNNFGVSLDSVRLELGDLDDSIDYGFDAVGNEVFFSEGEITLHSVGSTKDLAIAVNESLEVSDHYEVEFEFEAASKNWHNAFFAFDYEGPDNFKYAGARVGANYWTIGEYSNGVFRDLARLPENILEDTRMDVKIEVENGQVKLTADGVEKVQYDFGTSFAQPQVGLVSQNSLTTIKDFMLTDLGKVGQDAIEDGELQIIDFGR